jgi:hypothetical protein
MRTALMQLISSVVVGVAFALSGGIEAEGWRLLAFIVSSLLLTRLFVQRYPRHVSIAWGLKLKPGEKVEAEGK